MPFDPRISLAAQAPAFADPMDMYKDYMSLRDLVDQRRVRDLQVRRLELQEEQDRREQEELRNVTDLLRTNPKATPQEIFSVSPNKGPGLVKGLYEAGKAQFESRKSQADFAESERQRGRTVQKEMVDQMRSLLELPEAARPAAYQKMLQSNIARGIVPPEAADQPMPTNEEIWQQYAQYHGAIATEDLREKIASAARAKEKEARDAALFNPQYSTAQANANLAQLKLVGKEPIQPAQQAQLDISGRLDSPDKIAVALSDPNLPPYKRTQLEQARDRMIQQRILTAPQNIPLSPTVMGQREQLLKAGEAAKPATQAQYEVTGFYRRLGLANNIFNRMEETVQKMGDLDQIALNAPDNYLVNKVIPENVQELRTAMKQFTEARLRKESGAAIPAQEFENDRRMYFPQPGDKPATLKLKKQARDLLIDSFRRAGGKAVAELEEAAPEKPNAGPLIKWGKDANGNPVRLP